MDMKELTALKWFVEGQIKHRQIRKDGKEFD